jgi:hypothetical protein
VGQRGALKQHKTQLVLIVLGVLVGEGDTHPYVAYSRGELNHNNMLLSRLEV